MKAALVKLKNNPNIHNVAYSIIGLGLAYGALYTFYFSAAKTIPTSYNDYFFEGLLITNFLKLFCSFGFDKFGLKSIGSIYGDIPSNFLNLMRKLLVVPFLFCSGTIVILYVCFTLFGDLPLFSVLLKYKYFILLGPLLAFNNIIAHYLRAFHERIMAFMLQLGIIYSILTAVILYRYFYGEEISLVATYSVAIVISIIVGLTILTKHIVKNKNNCGSHTEQFVFDRELFFLSGTTALTFFYSGMDVFLIKWLMPDLHTAPYIMANRIAFISYIGLMSTNNMLAPMVAKHYKASALDVLGRVYIQNSKIAGFLSMMIIIGLLIILYPIVSFLGSDYNSLLILIPIFLLARYIDSAVGGVNISLQMMDRARQTFYIQLFVLLSSLPLYYYLISNYNTLGAAIANSVSLFAWNILSFWYLKKIIGTQMRVTYLYKYLAIIICSYIIMRAVVGIL